MINVDLTKMLHPRFWQLLPAFLPGLSFEISVFLANPQLFQPYASQAHLDRYSAAGVTLLGAFLLGTGFMFLVSLLHVLLYRVHQLARKLWLKLLTYSMRSSWFAKSQFVTRAYNKETAVFHGRLHGAQRAWRRAARQLLQQRYGIELPVFPDYTEEGEWYVWTGVLGTPDPEPIKGLLFIAAIHATGWSGIVAAYCAPSLRNRFYLALPLFLIGFCVIQVFRVAAWWNDPIGRWTLRMRSVLTDIPSPSGAGEKKTGELPIG